MPEGHSIKRLANTFEKWFVGTRCFASSPQGRFERGAALISGQIMTDARSVGKHLFLRFDPPTEVLNRPGKPQATDSSRDGAHVTRDTVDLAAGPEDAFGVGADALWLHVHLGLYGAWRFHADQGLEIVSSIGAPRTNPSTDLAVVREDTGLAPAGLTPLKGRWNEGGRLDVSEAAEDGVWQAPEPIGAVRLRIDNGSVAADLAGPTRCEVLTPQEAEAAADRLGPDPLDTDSDPQALRARFVQNVRTSGRAIGELVMDQSIIAGVGNIYRAEGLFRQGISPSRHGKNVSESRLGALWDDYVYLLNKGVEEGRIVTVRDRDRPDVQLVQETDPEALRWYVYHRSGRPCLVCGSEVKEKEVQNRKLFWCGTCQR